MAEGIAASVALLVSAACADLGHPLVSLRVDGGLTRSRLLMQAQADVVVIGAGVVGTAIARTLARYSLELVLLDAAPDVGTGTSKANTAILHTGFDAKPGSLESRLLRRGSALLRAYAEAAGIAVERTGALLVAWTPEQAAALPAIEQNARRNGYLRWTGCSAATGSPSRRGGASLSCSTSWPAG